MSCQSQHPVVIICHVRERVAKCTLTALQGRPGFQFHKAVKGFRFDATGCLLLGLKGPVLSRCDRTQPLLLLDSTWCLLPQLERCLTGEPLRRTLPAGIKTAYPRRSKISADPQAGLSSIEAFYIALKLLDKEDLSVLDGYHWRTHFLESLESLN